MAAGDNAGMTLADIVIAGPSRALAVPITTVDVSVLKTSAELIGYSFKETTGANNAEVDLYDGTDAKGQSVAFITLSPGQSIREYFGLIGIELRTGLYAHVVSGSVQGAVYVRL